MHRVNGIQLFIAVSILVMSAAGCASEDGTRVLFVVSNHGELGDTGEDTGVWMAEVTHPFFAVADSALADDVTIDLASPDGGDAPIDTFSVLFNFDDFLATGVPDSGDPANERFITSDATRHWIGTEAAEFENPDGTITPITAYRFVDTLRLADIDASAYDAIYFAGGNGAMWQFPDSDDVHAIVRDMYESDSIVAAACHGTAALLNTRLSDGNYLVDGRRVTGFSTAEEEYLGQAELMPLLLQESFPMRGGIYVEAEPWTPNVVIDGRLISGQNPPSAEGVGEALAGALIGE